MHLIGTRRCHCMTQRRRLADCGVHDPRLESRSPRDRRFLTVDGLLWVGFREARPLWEDATASFLSVILGAEFRPLQLIRRVKPDGYLFPGRASKSPRLGTRQYARIANHWVEEIFGHLTRH
jgi:hypothetical protein